ncbi:M14 family metallocarboxypeptidase [Cohnella faecalis]|uniref:Carboxypeptidase n=1 Tax=Cohnella faecalis TaxID=2315694 RepID=A0A398CD91_9BACL|nr:M14 family metallocarboxypeptidase [Cohnella faecalis]RIE00385.1 carboxypeptidase [Cohnella faecalis]
MFSLIRSADRRTRLHAVILVLCFLATTLLPTSFAASAAESPINIVEPKQTYTYEIMTRDIKALAKQYPELIRYRSAGKSEYNRDLWVMEVGRGEATVLLNGSHHAREWISTILLMEMTENIALSDKNDSKWGNYRIRDLLDHVTFQIVPMVNPDGVTLQQKGLDAFPKKDHAALLKMNGGSRNFKRWKANAKGVDLNRQYPANWEQINNPAPGPHYMNYKGKKPLEAKEAQAMFKLANDTKPTVAVSYHSSGEILYWNYKTPAANVKRDLELATDFSAMTGYKLVKPVAKPSGGGFNDWFIQHFAQPGLTPELSPSVGETSVPLANWDSIWKKNKNAVWLVGTTAVKLSMDKKRATETAGWIELKKEATAYQWPMLNSATFGLLAPDYYEVTRTKGDWIEIKTEAGLRWISDRNNRKLSADEIAALLKEREEPEAAEEPGGSVEPSPTTSPEPSASSESGATPASSASPETKENAEPSAITP